MARELEVKLFAAHSGLQRIASWLNQAGLGQPGQALSNTYFDTPDAQLNQQKIALRIRQSGASCVQTLKTKGTATRGLHDRQEWDWRLAGPGLDLAVLKASPIGPIAEDSELRPVFTTDFERRTWLWEESGDAVEFALDRGRVRADTDEVPICEVELELKGGSGTRLMALAAQLAELCPVFLNPVSKAEQGYYLAGLYQPRPLAEEGLRSVDGWFRALGYFALTGQADFLGQAREAVLWLQRETSETDGLPAEQWQALVELHDRLRPGTPQEARAQLLEGSLLGQSQLALIQG